jgi:ComF family protein
MKWTRPVYDWSAFRQIGTFCPLCGAESNHLGLCDGCRGDLPDLGAACHLCAAPLPQAGTCGPCLQRPPPFTTVCAFRYESPLSDLLIELKFHGRLVVARLLGGLLAERLAGLPVARPEVVVPVPLHPQRLRERGYNQALELARPVARRLGLRLAPELGVRLRPTASQSDLDLVERRRNVRSAFAAAGPVPRSVAIIDDVVTTGSTVGAFAEALRRGGAEEIQVWAVARAAH